MLSLQSYRSRYALAMLMLGMLFTLSANSADPYEDKRELMVRIQIAGTLFGRTSVEDEEVLKAMRTVPRHEFVPQNVRQDAYDDTPLPIGNNQTISQPYIVAFMTEALRPKPDHTVLEIGTGSGYQAAVLGEIVEEVYSIEIVPELGKRAAKVLQSLGHENIHTRIGDGYKGWPEHAPFDGIIVTAAPDHIPAPLLKQLKPGGRLVIPVGPEGKTQKLLVIQKNADGSTTEEELMLVRFVPFMGDRE